MLVFCCYKQCCNGLSFSTSELPQFTLRSEIEGLWDMCVFSVAGCWQFILQNGYSNEYIINKIEYFSDFSTSSPVLDNNGLFNLYQFDGYKMVSHCFNFHLSDYCGSWTYFYMCCWSFRFPLLYIACSYLSSIFLLVH